MNKLSNILIVIAIASLVPGCKKDASVALAECIGKARNELIESNLNKFTKQCDVGLKGNYLVVLHPAAELDGADYKSHGLKESEIKTLINLRSSGRMSESIYIIPLDGQEPPSRTTSQGTVVSLHGFISARNNGPFLKVTLEWTPESIYVVGLQ
jgi:hypothetical protein